MNGGPAKPWFAPKQYGYGAVPSSWEGWALVLAFVAADALLGWFLIVVPARTGELGVFQVAIFLGAAAVLIVGLVMISKAKTAGEWRWRSGENR